METALQISFFCLTIVLFECDGYLNLNFLQARHVDIPYLPMLVPPKKWKGYVGVHVLDLSSKFLSHETIHDWIHSRTYSILLLVI